MSCFSSIPYLALVPHNGLCAALQKKRESGHAVPIQTSRLREPAVAADARSAMIAASRE
jgi:hypothetical protein